MTGMDTDELGFNHFFDMDGEPIGLMAWADLFSDFAGRTLIQQEWDGFRVITVWLGLDPDYWGPSEEYGDPHIFGTAVYRNGRFTQDVTSTSRESALETHRLTVDQLKGV